MSKARVSPDRELLTPEYSLSDVRWLQHRQKIGLSVGHNLSSPRSRGRQRTGTRLLSIGNISQDLGLGGSATIQSHIMDTKSRRQQDFINHITSTFKRKECIRFVAKKTDPAKKGPATVVCHCGGEPEKHIKGTGGVSDFFMHGVDATNNDLNTGKMSEEWKKEECIREFPTNGFGKVDFVLEGLGGRKPSKFIRLADDTPVDEVIDLFLNNWNLNRPHPANLVITVIGGAKNFKLDGRKKEIFNAGLIRAAQTTHGWIITSGCNMGVMKAVGEAVQEGQSYNWDKYGMTHLLRCIGIAPWGYVERRECLVNKSGQGSWNASYKVNNIIRHFHPVSLNPNHTHFVLVDDGFRGRYGGVADLRAKLEKKISLPKEPKDGQEAGLGIPVVLVVVEGGTDAIKDVSRSLKQKIPVVLCEGTGRAADILSYAYRQFVTTRNGERVIQPKHQQILQNKLRAAYGKTWSERSNELEETKAYMKIVLECCEDEKLITVFDMNKHEDLDLAILSALLKGQGASSTVQLHDQLKLALTWNRSDVAEEKIFSQSIVWDSGQLDDIMTDALLQHKVNFVRLLLQNGVVMKEFLTVARLRSLYNNTPQSSHLRQLLKRQTILSDFTLRDVGKLLRKLMGKHNDEMYNNDGPIVTVGSASSNEEAEKRDSQTFQEPFRELFLWAVLINRQDLAKFLWERGEESIPSALAASRIYGALADLVAHYDLDLRESYLKHKGEFEHLAVKVLDECHNTDMEKAAMLIERKYTTWGDINCLELAAAAHDREFLSTVCCQNSLNLMWKRGIVSHWLTVFLALLFPPLIFCGIRFQHMGEMTEKLSPWQKFLTFYRAPATKFSACVMMYIAFLILYSYVILFDFRHTITFTEWIIIFWLFTLMIEEIREIIFASKADSFADRVKDWWNFSAFNAVDMIVLVLAMIGFVLRFIDGTFIQAKTVYCINCVFLFIRVLSFYTASSYLGPKLVMIKRMFSELVLYIMILVVFLLAYGISSQALMFPIRDPHQIIFRDVFYYPYWQIYGELYLEELEGRTDDCLGNSTMMADGTPCPQFNWLVPVLTAAYLLVGNVLLLNILIAIFNHVFEEIETNSIQIWKYGMYFLVVEYDNKPGLAPPFVIFEHIFLFLRWFCRQTCCTEDRNDVELLPNQVQVLQIFEKECCKQFIQKFKLSEREDFHKKIKFIESRVDEMAKMMEEERLLEQQHYEAEENNRIMMATCGEGTIELPGESSKDRPVSRGSTSSGGLGEDNIPRKDQDKNINDCTESSKPMSRKLARRLESIDEAKETNREPKEVDSNLETPTSTMGQDALFPPQLPEVEITPKSTVDKVDAKVTAECAAELKTGPETKEHPHYSGNPWETDSNGEDAKLHARFHRQRSSRHRKKKKHHHGHHQHHQHQLNPTELMDSGEYHEMGSMHSRHPHVTHTQRFQYNDYSPEERSPPPEGATDYRSARTLEHRLSQLEQSTSSSLFNIEALMRGAVFGRGNALPPNLQPRSSYYPRDGSPAI